MHFDLGNVVRVVGLPNSEWQNSRGIVIGVVQGSGTNPEGEYALELQNGCHRWFLERHLSRSIPERLVRFFRAEVQDRWKQVQPTQVAALTGDYDELVHFLCDICGFTTNRALSEAEEFYRFFNDRMMRATTGGASAYRVAA